MHKPAKSLLSGALLLAMTSLACLSTQDVIGAIAEPLPMATAGAPDINFETWQPGPPVPIGTSQQIGDMTLVVTNVIRPANHVADDATFYTEPERGEEYVAVYLEATCKLPSDQTCRVADFTATGAKRSTYFADFLAGGASHGFESGDLKGGSSRAGYVFFVVDRDDTGLVMRYPNVIGNLAPTGLFIIEE